MKVIPLADILAAAHVRTVESCLKADGVIAYPTDTLYGLGGSFFSLPAAKKIDAMKGRNDQPYSVAVGSQAMLRSLVAEVPEIFPMRLKKLLPGKFTFLFKPSPAIDPRLLKGSDRIGIRLPDVPGLLKLIEKIGLPLLSTSANRSGEPPLNDPRRIAREFPDIDLLIDGGVLPASAGSTVVDLTVVPPRIVRPGDDAKRILEVLRGIRHG